MDGVAVASLAISGASLAVSIVATLIAKGSLNRSNESIGQASQVAKRAHDDWRQQKWFDLYFKANKAYDAVEEFQAHFTIEQWNTPEIEREWDSLVLLIRELHSLAAVFPKHEVIDRLFAATMLCDDPALGKQEVLRGVLAKTKLDELMDAMEGIRRKALVDVSVLD